VQLGEGPNVPWYNDMGVIVARGRT